jgi:hypothetical protein
VAQVVNACGPHRQWEGTEWVLQQIQSSGLRPNSTTYGLAIEVKTLFQSTLQMSADTLGCGSCNYSKLINTCCPRFEFEYSNAFVTYL